MGSENPAVKAMPGTRYDHDGIVVPKMTHVELVKRAASWLRGRSACVVLTELVTLTGEIPDAIGWIGGFSTMIECKASRADFNSDCLKPSRRSQSITGYKRYYMVPHSMISVDEVEDPWGLIYVGNGTKAYEVKAALPNPNRSLMDEIRMLSSALRRIRDTVGVKQLDELIKPGRSADLAEGDAK